MANDEPPGRQRAVWIALGVSVVTALATGFALTTVLGVSDTLTGDISTALTRADPPRDSGMRIIVHGSPTGVGRGMQLALFGLLMGGIPSALLSAALVAVNRKSKGTPWSGEWAPVFLAGFLYQLSSVGLTSLLLVLLLLYARDAGAPAKDVLFYGGFLGLNLLCGMAGLHFWHELQAGIRDEPARIAPPQPGS